MSHSWCIQDSQFAMDEVNTTDFHNTTDYLVLSSPAYTDTYKLYALQFCLNKLNRLIALQAVLRVNRKYNTELNLLQHGDFNQDLCFSQGNFAFAQNDTLAKLTLQFDSQGLNAIKVSSSQGIVHQLGDPETYINLTYSFTYSFTDTQFIGFSSIDSNSPQIGILTLTPIQVSLVDPCPQYFQTPNSNQPINKTQISNPASNTTQQSPKQSKTTVNEGSKRGFPIVNSAQKISATKENQTSQSQSLQKVKSISATLPPKPPINSELKNQTVQKNNSVLPSNLFVAPLASELPPQADSQQINQIQRAKQQASKLQMQGKASTAEEEDTDDVDQTIYEHKIKGVQSLLSPNRLPTESLTFTSQYKSLPDTIQPGLFALIGLLWLIISLIFFACLRHRDSKNKIKPLGQSPITTIGKDEEANPTERQLVTEQSDGLAETDPNEPIDVTDERLSSLILTKRTAQAENMNEGVS